MFSGTRRLDFDRVIHEWLVALIHRLVREALLARRLEERHISILEVPLLRLLADDCVRDLGITDRDHHVIALVPVDERSFMRRDFDLEDAYVFVLKNKMVMRLVLDGDFGPSGLLGRLGNAER